MSRKKGKEGEEGAGREGKKEGGREGARRQNQILNIQNNFLPAHSN